MSNLAINPQPDRNHPLTEEVAIPTGAIPGIGSGTARVFADAGELAACGAPQLEALAIHVGDRLTSGSRPAAPDPSRVR